MSIFADIEPFHKAAKGTSTLAGLNIYRQLHLCTVFVESHICIWLWLTGIWGWHWLLICGFTNIVTIHFYSPFAYVTFLAGLFQEEDFHLKDVYYSKLKDFMGNCCNRVQDWVAHIDHLMNNMRSEA
jgi:hypothetical protein